MVLRRPAFAAVEGPAADARLRVRYLGTAGFVVELAGRTLVLDPFVTRPGLWRTVFGRLRPDEARIARYIPEADDVLVGHAHYDHVLDAPALCRQTGARLIGSPSVCNVGRAAGLSEEQMRETLGREDIACGGVTVRGLPSRHGKVYFNRVPLPGNIETPPRWPPRLRDLRHGEVLNWYLEADGLRLLHVDSADYIERELDGLQVDLLCLCAIGWTRRPNYVNAIVDQLRPRYVLPCHWDWLFSPLERPARVLPGCRLDAFIGAIRQAGSEPIPLPMLGAWGIS